MKNLRSTIKKIPRAVSIYHTLREFIKSIPGTVIAYHKGVFYVRKIKAYKLLYLHFGSHSKDNIVIDEKILHNIKYDDLFQLHYIMQPNQYNKVMHQIAKINLNQIRKQQKVKISFVLYDSAMWCGDLLYQYLENDSKFDVEILLSMRTDQAANTETSRLNFEKGVEKFRKKNLNVHVLYPSDDYQTDADILFYLTPYFNVLNKGLSFKNIPLNCLICFVTYGISDTRGFADIGLPIRYFTWHEFVDSKLEKELITSREYRKGDGVVYTGYPRMDTFYQFNKPDYHWKMVTSYAKKIIWAPHWSINEGYLLATFQKNYKWFYTYAKQHPKTTSWVVKPHPNLMFSAVRAGIFKTDGEFQRYLRAWDSLPNAKVEMGAYYQDIFKTSDAMILDSASFTAEYQYVHKPELFLTRGTDYWNELGHAIMDCIYTADGDDFKSIQDFIENVVVLGKDERTHPNLAFDKYLDYYHINGKLASENIYETIKLAITK